MTQEGGGGGDDERKKGEKQAERGQSETPRNTTETSPQKTDSSTARIAAHALLASYRVRTTHLAKITGQQVEPMLARVRVRVLPATAASPRAAVHGGRPRT